MKKYKLDELIQNAPKRLYKTIIEQICDSLDISTNTLHNYRKIELNASQDIPYHSVLYLEKFFDMEPGTLTNVTAWSDSDITLSKL